ncbi:hypothetical protein CRG98_017299 [Punica granatum]|uniref:CCHC-type domain-containing protein n=1 Tax=Punica granatum TaxID=22663 RepID=A0A2I0K166_PUNGR|nr:hypothetical protein CRG98_017299 [Punica granatum]
MSDVSDDEKSPRLGSRSSTDRKEGDSSVRSMEVPAVYRLASSDSTGAQDGLNVREYYGKLKLLWDELEFYLAHPGCSCGANATIAAQREAEKSYQFLMGLTSEFNTIRSTILSIEPLPNLDKIYNMVANEERQRVVARSKEIAPASAVFLAIGETERGRPGIEKLQSFGEGEVICSHCGKPGHTKGTCWATIGYPAWHFKSKTSARKGPMTG